MEPKDFPTSLRSESSFQHGISFEFNDKTHDARNLFGAQKRSSFDPPPFMLDPEHIHSSTES